MTTNLNISLEFQKLDGELDAAIVFAAAAEEQYCADQLEFGDVCCLDANDLYASVLEGISSKLLPQDGQYFLSPKLESLKLTLDRLRMLRLSMKDEAARQARSTGHATPAPVARSFGGYN